MTICASDHGHEVLKPDVTMIARINSKMDNSEAPIPLLPEPIREFFLLIYRAPYHNTLTLSLTKYKSLNVYFCLQIKT